MNAESKDMLQLKESNPLEMLRQVAVHLDADLYEDFGAARLFLNNSKGKGTISLYELFPGLTAWVYNMRFSKDYDVKMDFSEDRPYYFGYNVSGYQLQSYSYETEQYEIKQGQNFILIGEPGISSNFTIPGGIDFESCYLIITPKLLENHDTKLSLDLKSKLSEIFADVNIDEPYRYFGDIDSRTGLFAEIIVKNERTDLVGRLLTEGAVMNMLASEIEAHDYDLRTSDFQPDLSKAELSRITELGDYIRQNLDEKITIKDLWEHVGLSPKKLQRGIKFLYGYSANQYLTNIRLEFAKELLQTTDLQIGEISDRIGYASKSYFSSMFKKRFGILPGTIRASFTKGNLLFEVTYRSMAKEDLTDLDINKILSTARSANKMYGITGSLIFHRKVFFQLIEGPRESVLKLYDNIKSDSRHFDISTLWQGAKPSRDFEKWSMAMLTDSGLLNLSHDGNTEELNLGHLMGDMEEQSLLSKNLWKKVRNIIKTSS